MQNDSGLYGADAPSERHLRAPEGRPLAESGHALVPGEGRGHSVYEREVRSPPFSFKLPSVIRLLRYIKIKRNIRLRSVLAANIYARDDHSANTAARCSRRRISPSIMSCRSPRAAERDWENIVTCCVSCNRGRGTDARRSGHAPDPAPRRPSEAPAIRITVGLKDAPESWRDYFYWNMELDET